MTKDKKILLCRYNNLLRCQKKLNNNWFKAFKKLKLYKSNKKI